MWLEAILTKDDLQQVAEKFSPLKLLLSGGGSLLLAEPCEISMIPGAGVQLLCDAVVHWPVLGLDIPVTLRGLTLRVLPRVENRGIGEATHATLVFGLQIDHTGVAMLPSVFDPGITARLNEELEQQHVELAWNFIKTLSHVFGLPDSLASSSAFALRATAGKVQATETALGLAVDFEADVRTRGDSAGGDGPARAATHQGSTPGESASMPRSPSASRESDSMPRPRGEAPRDRARPAPSLRFDARSLAAGALATVLVAGGLRALGFGRRSKRR